MIDDPKPMSLDTLIALLEDKIHGDRGKVCVAKSHKAVGMKPCPFCGSTKTVVAQGTTFRWRRLKCCNCDMQTGEQRVQTLGEGTPEEWEQDVIRALIETWNTRHERRT